MPLGAYGFVALSSRDAPEPAALGAPPEASGGGPASAEGTWVVADVATNFAGYRVRERLGPVAAPSDAVARTDQVQPDLLQTVEPELGHNMRCHTARLVVGPKLCPRHRQQVRGDDLDRGGMIRAGGRAIILCRRFVVRARRHHDQRDREGCHSSHARPYPTTAAKVPRGEIETESPQS
jgi:hypothetical protein